VEAAQVKNVNPWAVFKICSTCSLTTHWRLYFTL
jgi:hypothetical protein